jgi:hypothetical protein
VEQAELYIVRRVPLLRCLILLLLLVLSSGAPIARAQTTGASAPAFSEADPLPTPTTPPLATVPDSVRQIVGYQHWKGAAMGGGLGALGGLFLALGVGECADCSSDSRSVGKVSLIGAGVGGALGFLVGLASPRYRWVRTTEP